MGRRCWSLVFRRIPAPKRFRISLKSVERSIQFYVVLPEVKEFQVSPDGAVELKEGLL